MNDTGDRRVRKTDAAIKQALYRLIVEKGFEAVTVTDILARADVGRSTFYAHFTGKHDVLHAGVDDLASSLRLVKSDRPGRPPKVFAFSVPLLAHVAEAPPFFRALIGADGQLVKRWPEMIATLVRNELTPLVRAKRTSVPLEALVQCVAGAYMALMTWWLDAGAAGEPEKIDAMFRRLTLPGLAAALKMPELEQP